MTAYPPRVFTVVLNYRRAEDTLRCAASLSRSAYRNLFLAVVDNGSDRDDVAALKAGLSATTIIETGANLGYAAGNNLGITHALDRDADYVWILNPDTEVRPDTLARLVELMSLRPQIGIAGSRILNGGDGGRTIWFNGGTIDWSRGGKTAHIDMGKPDASVPALAPVPVDYVTGASMLVRRDVFSHIGLLPERYFLYFEETDFNVRASRAGWRIVVDPRSRLLHYRRSWDGVPVPSYVYYFVRNRFLFAHELSAVPFDVVRQDIEEILASWRRRFARRGGNQAAAFERLVAKALEDGAAGRSGPYPDVNDRRWEDAVA